MKKIIFEAIAGYLAERLNTPGMISKYGACHYISVYNDQFNQEDEEHAIPKPALAIDFPSSDGWATATNNWQKGNMIISIYVATHTIADSNYFADELNKTEAMKRFEYTQDVHVLLQGLNLGAAGSLNRTNEFMDTNADHIAVDRIDYFTTVEDCLADPDRNWIEIDAEWRIIYKRPTDRPLPPVEEDVANMYNLHNKI
jgi:hypothetical protein